jgi:hypothetical protein
VHKLSEPNMVRMIIQYTKEHILPNEASKLPYPVNRVPFPQDKFQLISLWTPFAIVEDHILVEIMGDKIGRFQEEINVRWACTP